MKRSAVFNYNDFGANKMFRGRGGARGGMRGRGRGNNNFTSNAPPRVPSLYSNFNKSGQQPWKQPNKFQTESFDNYTKRQMQPRPPVNEEDRNYGTFFVDPKALKVYKNYLIETCSVPREVTALAEEQARFQYYYINKNFAFAKNHAKRKPPEFRKGRSFNCNICDEFYFTKQEIDKHQTLNRHSDVMLLFNNFRRIGDEWLAKKMDISYTVPHWVMKAEDDGYVCEPLPDKEERKKAESGEAGASSGGTPMTDDIFFGVDVTLSQDDFVLATYDNIMEVHWKKPTTTHFCRCCNYESFDSEEKLQEHQETQSHKDFEANYDASWCVSCQCHTGTAEALEKHVENARHRMIKQLLADTRVRAIKYWKLQQAKKRKEEADKKNDSEELKQFNESMGSKTDNDGIVPVGQFMCQICNVSLQTQDAAVKHKQSQQHRLMSAAGTSGSGRGGRPRPTLMGRGGSAMLPPRRPAMYSYEDRQYDEVYGGPSRRSFDPYDDFYPPGRFQDDYYGGYGHPPPMGPRRPFPPDEYYGPPPFGRPPPGFARGRGGRSRGRGSRGAGRM